MSTISLRTDPALEAALAALTDPDQTGTPTRTRSQAIREAVIAAAAAAEQERLREWSAKVGTDPADRAEIAIVRAYLDDGRAW